MADLVRYHTSRNDESCVRVALVIERVKYLHVLALTPSSKGRMSVWKVDKGERKYMRPLTLGKNKREYPISRALKGFRRMANTHGITKGAKKFLREVHHELEEGKKDAAHP